MKTNNPLYTFNVRYDLRGEWKRSCFVRVDVYRTRRELRKAYNIINPDQPITGPDSVNGYCTPVAIRKCERRPVVCFIGVSMTTGIGVLSHECVHAAHRVCLYDQTGDSMEGRIKFSFDGEEVAMATGNLVREIVTKFWSLEVWKK